MFQNYLPVTWGKICAPGVKKLRATGRIPMEIPMGIPMGIPIGIAMVIPMGIPIGIPVGVHRI